jgi:hypothetical protein
MVLCERFWTRLDDFWACMCPVTVNHVKPFNARGIFFGANTFIYISIYIYIYIYIYHIIVYIYMFYNCYITPDEYGLL